MNRFRAGTAAGIAILATFSPAASRGGDDLVVDGPQDAQPVETVRFAPVEVRLLGGAAGRAVEYDLGAMFDQHVFRRTGGDVIVIGGAGPRPVGLVDERSIIEADDGSVPGDTLARLANLRRLAAGRIAILDQVCRLDDAQREVLCLAVESDIRRLATEVDAVRRKYAGQRLQATRGIDRERLQALRDDAAACRRRIDHVWRSGSLLGSVSLGALSPAQLEVFRGWLAGRRAVRWEAMVRQVLGQLDESVLGLSEAQHAAILERLLGDVPPLAVFDAAWAGATGPRSGSFQVMLVVSRLGRLDREALRPLLDPRQWAAVEQVMGQHGGPEEVEALLVEQGVLEEEGS